MTFLLLIILGSVGSVIPKMVFNLPVTPYEVSTVVSVTQAKLSFLHYFAATDQLLVVFVCGLFIGYIIKCKPKINLGSQFTNCVLWVAMLLLPFISTSWNEGFKPLEGNFSQFSFLSWFVLSKIMWAFGFGWVMFACTTGRAGRHIICTCLHPKLIINCLGPLGDVFQLPLLRPLSKLAFTVYLNHITILGYRQLSKKDLSPLNHVEIVSLNTLTLSILSDHIDHLVLIAHRRHIRHCDCLCSVIRVLYYNRKAVLLLDQNCYQPSS